MATLKARPRCGRRMLDCCRSRCAGGVADVGCRIVADAVVEVYGIGGSLLYSGKSHRVSVPVDGIYVVRVNGKPHKVVEK